MANAQHLKILRKGMQVWNSWREMNPDIKPNLRGVNLQGADLRGFNLSSVDFTGANLKGANLSGFFTGNYFESESPQPHGYFSFFSLAKPERQATNLQNAKLEGANLEGANLTGANLRGADLEGADLVNADLKDTDLYNTNLHNTILDIKSQMALSESLLQLQFDGIFPSPFITDTWQDLLVYVYFENAFQKVSQDFERRKQTLTGAYAGTSTSSQTQIPRDSSLTIVPNVPSVTFNPPAIRFRMTEDYHCLQFRVMHNPTSLVKMLGCGKIVGTINIYLENLLIGEISVQSNWEVPGSPSVVKSIMVNSIMPQQASTESSKNELKRQTSRQFQKIFVSYSSKDSAIVARLEKAYIALGHEYWRDIKKLRSGEAWSPAIQHAINDSDIFQLCWSNNSKASTYVEQEWRAALARDLPTFIRPVYWEKPIPTRPKELSHLHFAQYPLDDK